MSATVHLVKLSVGPASFSELKEWQELSVQQRGEIIHVTRNTPKRAAELLTGGSIYWVIKGVIVGRNRITELRPMVYDGQNYCGIVCEPGMVRVAARPRRPFQGWRYLEAKDAPADISGDADEIPEEMLRELSELGLL